MLKCLISVNWGYWREVDGDPRELWFGGLQFPTQLWDKSGVQVDYIWREWTANRVRECPAVGGVLQAQRKLCFFVHRDRGGRAQFHLNEQRSDCTNATRIFQ